ncbi:hypothetical protein FJTKL_09285 [Diaporthe vaccinii]|uniref:Uncharacterized protein n=1 Tax=Diaporthe vaccinii TaxID=105482 RepID=A0ABR4EP25_9PEZI
MSPHQTQRIRQYAVPGCCYEKPIIIGGDEQVAPIRTRPKPISNHTATWLEEMARERREGRVNRPVVANVQAQGRRKRTVLDVDDYNEEPRKGGAKRVRLSGGDSYPTHLTSHVIDSPFYQNHNHNLTKTNYEKAEDTLAELEAGLRTRQRQIDQERAIVRNIQLAEEQARLREEEEQARTAELQDQQYRSTVRSSLHITWQNHDRDRQAADERLKNIEREQREAAQAKEREEEEKRNGELARMEVSLKSMWETHDLEQRRTPKIRPGQLSEAGQRRVREHEERMGRRRI